MTFEALVALAVAASSGAYEFPGELQEPFVAPVSILSSSEARENESPLNEVLQRITAIARPSVRLSEFSSSLFVREYDPTLSLHVSRGELGGFDTSMRLSIRL